MIGNAPGSRLTHLINFKISRYALIFYSLAGVLLLIIAIQEFVPVEYLTRDAAVVAGGRFYAGIVSNLGLFVWCTSAVITFFSWLVLAGTGNRQERKFLLWGATITFMLLLDDFLLLHELIFPRFLGISENFFVLIYPLSILIFTVYFLQIIVRTQILVYLSALFFLGFSMLFDKILPSSGNFAYLVEDGCKLLGIVGWCSYFVHTCLHIIERKLKQIPSVDLDEIPVISAPRLSQATNDKNIAPPN